VMRKILQLSQIAVLQLREVMFLISPTEEKGVESLITVLSGSKVLSGMFDCL